jgi:dUTP pyrophosphatase
MKPTIKFKKLREDAVIPQYAHGPEADAGMDLVAIEGGMLRQNTPTLIRTGLSVEIPPGFEGQVRSRSGLSLKGIVVANSPGTVDPSYRGELGVILNNVGSLWFTVKPGDRIAQLVVAPYARCVVETVEDLSETQRGEKGFGSTGV